MRERRIDWMTAVATAVSIVGSAVVFVSLYAAVSLPVLETLSRL